MMLNSKVLFIISVAMLLIVLGVNDASASSHFSSEIGVGDISEFLARDPPTDTDGDGIPDSSDSCPTQDETVNGFQDSDGCPDVVPPPTDTDGDGISDSIDQCPTQAETINGYQDLDGCPDEEPTTEDNDIILIIIVVAVTGGIGVIIMIVKQIKKNRKSEEPDDTRLM